MNDQQRELTHKPTGDREILLFYEAYDMGLQAGLKGAQVAIRQVIVENTAGWSLWQIDALRQIVEEGIGRAEAMRQEVDGKIEEVKDFTGSQEARPDEPA
jgi:hypothetical protein